MTYTIWTNNDFEDAANTDVTIHVWSSDSEVTLSGSGGSQLSTDYPHDDSEGVSLPAQVSISDYITLTSTHYLTEA
jgi:hypothetical protein